MSEYLKTLNKDQYEAATTLDGFLFILAGAGSGKTKTLIARTAYMLEKGIDPKSILLVTFTNKAANEIKNRIQKITDASTLGITACTFHSFCALILRKYCAFVGLPQDFNVLDAQDSSHVIKMCIDEYLEECKGTRAYSDFFKPSLIEKVDDMAVNNDISYEAVVDDIAKLGTVYEDFKKEILDVLNKYTAYKKNNHYLDFNDLQYYMKKLLSENEAVRAEVDERYKYISCDEYQDTNTIQNNVLELLSINYPNLAVVGDDNQSIYKFRGANIQNILSFTKKHPNCKQVVLNINYRSVQPVLSLANSVMEYAEEGIPKILMSAKGHGPKPVIVKTGNQYREADAVLALMRQYGMHPGKTAVIYRSNSSASVIEGRLNNSGIPYVKYGGIRFNEKKVVKDILAFLRFQYNPLDEIAALRLFQLFPGIGPGAARAIFNEVLANGANGLLSKALSSKKYAPSLISLHDFLKKIKGLRLPDRIKQIHKYYTQLRLTVIQTSNIKQSAKINATNELNEAAEDIDTLALLSSTYTNTAEFISDLSLERASKKDAVNSLVLTTIHSAKGLEFENVFVLDCVDGYLPSANAVKEGDANEELRCFYVAITRAEKRLFLMVPQYEFSLRRTDNPRH